MQFYFDHFDGTTLSRDDEGGDFADNLAAREEAEAALCEMAKYSFRNSVPYVSVIKVRDASGLHILTATLSLKTEMALD